MRVLFQLAFLALLTSTFTGCFDGRPVSRLDSGPVLPPPTDSGPITLTDSGPGCAPESTASACTDFADNDCDGQIDCNDISCCSAVTCATGTLCGNMRVDAGVDAGRDAGPTSCPSTTFPNPLSSSCLPRCSAATESAALSCTTGECVGAAYDADTTPSVSAVISGTTVALNCRLCTAYQQQVCMYNACPTEFAAWAECDPDFTDCTSQLDDLDLCLDASSTFRTCFDREWGRCFP